MSLVVFTVAGAIAMAALLVIIYTLLYIQNREIYLRYWMLAWILILISLICVLGSAVNHLLLIIYLVCLVISNYFLMCSAHQIFGVRMSPYWKYCALSLIIWLVTSYLLGLPDQFRNFPWSFFSGISGIYYGSMFLRFGDKNINGRIITGLCYILWGIHALDCPFLKSIPWFVSWGFLIAAMLAVGGAVGMLCYYFETKNKELMRVEKELKYMSFHDSLTGLFNRNYFEREIKCREKEKRTAKTHYPPTGIIICDVDGLKLVNDTLGHERGDALLMEAARIIRNVFAKNGLAARIGGDEFAVLLEADEEGLALAYENIRQALSLYNADKPELPLSISIGYAAARSSVDLGKAFKEADNNMYREKIKQSQGVRDSIIESLMLALNKKEFSRYHTANIQKIILDLSGAANLNTASEADLCLLAKYHNIGNIGIMEEVLFKPGLLDDYEKEKIIRHCEIGYRIAQAASELSAIADWILKHHEWWNGEGYPLGLRGEEIPLECRIFAIADAYEAMMNHQTYSNEASPAEALEELNRWAGTQFDPVLTELFCGMYSCKQDVTALQSSRHAAL